MDTNTEPEETDDQIILRNIKAHKLILDLVEKTIEDRVDALDGGSVIAHIEANADSATAVGLLILQLVTLYSMSIETLCEYEERSTADYIGYWRALLTMKEEELQP